MSVSLISVAELKEPNSSRIVIDTRLKKQYDAGHIPGAIWLRWEEWCETAPDHAEDVLKQPGYWGRLADPLAPAFVDRLCRLGLNTECEIVVHSAGMRSKGSDGRVAWMLLYLGAKNVRLLNGTWQDCVESGAEVETKVVPREPAEFELNLQPARRAMLSDLKELIAKDQVILIDTRSAPEFAGDCYDYQPRKGRFPGAILLPFRAMFSAGRHYITRDEYLAMLPVTGIDKMPVSYCEVGVRAATVALLHEIYTQQTVPVYDGSLMEWSLDLALPLSYGASD